MRRTLLACSWMLVLALALAGSALAGNGGVAPPAESPNAQGIRDLHWILLGITGVIFVLVEGTLLVFIVRFRSKGRGREVEGPQIRGHTRLELIWTVIPVLIVVAIISVVFYKLGGIQDVRASGPGGPKMTVKVEGRQFYWRYVYPNGATSVDDLRVPVGRPVELVITAPSREVAHSWWVPALAGKMDAIPGKTNKTWFMANHAGVYRGQCAEFCGAQHALMIASVTAMPGPEYERWVAARARAGVNLGQETFAGACSPCHGMQGEGLIGPPLKGLAVTPQRVRDLVTHGGVNMPAVGQGWSDAQLNALIAYLRKDISGGG